MQRDHTRACALVCAFAVLVVLPPLLWATSDEPLLQQSNSQLSFVVWGHPRGPGDGDPPLYFEEILDRIRSLAPDAVFVTGDVVSGGASRSKPFDPDIIRSDWQRFIDKTNSLDAPVFIAPGNHDVNNFATRDIFLEFAATPPYGVTLGSSRFLILDSVGIEQRRDDAGRYWDLAGLPFDEEQIAFVSKEISDPAHEHIFLFMHHTQPWADSDGWWWKKMHPLLRNSNVRAVFSGDPWGGKFGFVFKDNIKYVQSAIWEGVPPHWFRQNRDKKSTWYTFHQLDNILHVTVTGNLVDPVQIEPIVVGAFASDAGSWKYWEQVEDSWAWSQRLPEWFYARFYRLRNLLIFLVCVMGLAFVAGAAAVLQWRRFS